MSQIGFVGPPLAALLPAAGSAEALAGAARFVVGDLVEAEIVQFLGRGEGLIRIDGRLFQGIFPEDLATGVRQTLRVVAEGPPLRLQTMASPEEEPAALLRPPAQGLASAIRALIEADLPPEDPGTDGLLQTARQLLKLPAEPGDLAHALARWVRSSGVLSKAGSSDTGEDSGDLKAVTLKLLSRLPEGELTRALRALAGHLEAHQARSVLEGAAVFPLVLPWGEEWVRGELRIEEPGRRGSGSRGAAGRLRIRLEMPHLGPVEVRMIWHKGVLGVRLALEPGALEAARARIAELNEALTRTGIPRLALRVEPLAARAPAGRRGFVEVIA